MSSYVLGILHWFAMINISTHVKEQEKECNGSQGQVIAQKKYTQGSQVNYY